MNFINVDNTLANVNRPMTDKQNEHFVDVLVGDSCPMSIYYTAGLKKGQMWNVYEQFF